MGGERVDTGLTAATIQLGKTGIMHGSRTYVIQSERTNRGTLFYFSPGIGPIHANLAAQRRQLSSQLMMTMPTIEAAT